MNDNAPAWWTGAAVYDSEERGLIVGGGLRATGTAATLPGTGTCRGSRTSGAVARLVPAAPLEGEPTEGDELFDPAAAGRAGGQGGIGELLAGFEDDPASVTFIFVDGHDGTPPVKIAAVI